MSKTTVILSPTDYPVPGFWITNDVLFANAEAFFAFVVSSNLTVLKSLPSNKKFYAQKNDYAE